MTTRKPDDPGAPRDPRLDAAWRAASHEEPPVALDAAILAAARREVGARPQSLGAQAAMRARRRWWPLAAAATIAAVAIGVVQRITHEDLGAPANNAVVSDMPTQAAKPAAEAARSTTETVPPALREEAAASGGGPAAEGRLRADEAAPELATGSARPAPAADAARRSAPVVAAPAPMRRDAPPAARPPPVRQEAPPAAPPSPAPMKQESSPAAGGALPEPFPAATPKLDAAIAPGAVPAAHPAEAGGIAASATAPRPAPMAKTAAAPAESQRKEAEARSKDRAPLPIPDWIILIRRLRAEGNTADAARELAAFRAAHADHEKLLPPDLRDWRPAEK